MRLHFLARIICVLSLIVAWALADRLEAEESESWQLIVQDPESGELRPLDAAETAILQRVRALAQRRTAGESLPRIRVSKEDLPEGFKYLAETAERSADGTLVSSALVDHGSERDPSNPLSVEDRRGPREGPQQQMKTLGDRLPARLIAGPGLAGTDAKGRLRILAPDPVRLGRNVAHWDTRLLPEPLMAAFVGIKEFYGDPNDLDLTPTALQDVGWSLGESQINLVVLDPEGFGFNDPTPVEPVGGNSGRTLGDQRLLAARFAADIWSRAITSPVPIEVGLVFDPELRCRALGQSFLYVSSNFPGTTRPDTWFPISLANVLQGEDRRPDLPDMKVIMSPFVDQGRCTSSFYYGLDGQPRVGEASFVTTVLHEMGHGLGFFVFPEVVETGMFFMGQPQINFIHFYDNTLGKSWIEMTDAERLASSAGNELVWTGENANVAALSFLEDERVLEVDLATGETVRIPASRALFGPTVPPGGISAELACGFDGIGAAPGGPATGANASDGCEPLRNAADLKGRIALLSPGFCGSSRQVRHAQEAGAVAAVLGDFWSSPRPLTTLSDASDLEIPAVSLGLWDLLGLRRVVCPEQTCGQDDPNLCLDQGRFRIEVDWKDFAGNTGTAKMVALESNDSGVLWFFQQDNWEMLVKVINGCPINDHFWVFAASTTNVEYTLRVTDLVVSGSKSYFNPLGRSAPAITDIEAIPSCFLNDRASDFGGKFRQNAGLPRVELPRARGRNLEKGPATCVPTEDAACLNRGRFRVEVDWETSDLEGRAQVVPVDSDDSGLLWFFDSDNWEMLVKVLDGCEFNDRFWVFGAATTDVGFDLRVTDTETGVARTWRNQQGNAAAAITDTDAFATCP